MWPGVSASVGGLGLVSEVHIADHPGRFLTWYWRVDGVGSSLPDSWVEETRVKQLDLMLHQRYEVMGRSEGWCSTVKQLTDGRTEIEKTVDI